MIYEYVYSPGIITFCCPLSPGSQFRHLPFSTSCPLFLSPRSAFESSSPDRLASPISISPRNQTVAQTPEAVLILVTFYSSSVPSTSPHFQARSVHAIVPNRWL